MLSEVIPINFAGGCGGSFLSTWLTTAKYNYRADLEFTDFGSMHSSKYCEILGHNSGLFDDFNSKLERIKKIKFLPTIYNNRFPPYFTTIHSNVDDIKSHFDKVINLTYHQRDIGDITACYLIKSKGTSQVNYHYINEYKTVLLKTKQCFKAITDSNICNISWNDIQYKSIEDLLLKLSSFLEIPKTSFNITSIQVWRNKNTENINLVNNILHRKH